MAPPAWGGEVLVRRTTYCVAVHACVASTRQSHKLSIIFFEEGCNSFTTKS